MLIRHHGGRAMSSALLCFVRMIETAALAHLLARTTDADDVYLVALWAATEAPTEVAGLARALVDSARELDGYKRHGALSKLAELAVDAPVPREVAASAIDLLRERPANSDADRAWRCSLLRTFAELAGDARACVEADETLAAIRDPATRSSALADTIAGDEQRLRAIASELAPRDLALALARVAARGGRVLDEAFPTIAALPVMIPDPRSGTRPNYAVSSALRHLWNAVVTTEGGLNRWFDVVGALREPRMFADALEIAFTVRDTTPALFRRALGWLARRPDERALERAVLAAAERGWVDETLAVIDVVVASPGLQLDDELGDGPRPLPIADVLSELDHAGVSLAERRSFLAVACDRIDAVATRTRVDRRKLRALIDRPPSIEDRLARALIQREWADARALVAEAQPVELSLALRAALRRRELSR